MVELDRAKESHSAAASMAGYLYQVRYALLRALEEGRRRPGKVLLIEQFDDVAFTQDGNAIELIQTKHHVTPGDTSDQSVDLWRTLAVWIDRLVDDPQTATNSRLVLVTTNIAPENSVLAMLRGAASVRNETEAMKALCSAARQSRNLNTRSARAKFLNLTEVERRLLVSNIWVFDRAPNLLDMRTEIEDVVHYSVTEKQLEEFTDQLEGWWFSRVVQALTGEGDTEIPVVSVVGKVTELRERYRINNLALDEDLETSHPQWSSTYGKFTFVKQMHLVDIGDKEQNASVFDYYRAYQQRSRWARENLLLDGETDRYDRSLVDAWERRFLAHMSEVDSSTKEALKQSLGRDVFRWSRELQKPIRNRDELWLSAGSLQMLADSKRIGWHPDFAQRLTDSESEQP